MLQDAKTVIRGDFDQETAKKIAPPIIARLDLTNCTYLPTHCRVETLQSFSELFSGPSFVDRYCVWLQCIAVCRVVQACVKINTSTQKCICVFLYSVLLITCSVYLRRLAVCICGAGMMKGLGSISTLHVTHGGGQLPPPTIHSPL